jgi:hypothetical protein
MTNAELANLAFTALVRDDDNERETILDNVQHVNYLTLHYDFKRRFLGYLNLGGYYGLIYWKTRASMTAADCHQQLNTLGAMDAALQVVCDNYNLEINAVRKYALCADEPLFNQVYVDQAQIVEFESLFSELVE